MTIIMPEDLTCAICEKESTQQVLISTNAMGHSDLDLRPPEMQRSTMHTWVQRCRSCGYCAPSIEEAIEGAETLLGEERYRKIRAKRSYPALARDFLCWSLLAENAGDLLEAGWAALHAAWVLDDEGKEKVAAECRGKAADLFIQAIKKRKKPCKSAGESELLVTDILRRCGRFEDARDMGLEGLDRMPRSFVEKLLLFELERIKEGDTGRYTVKDALPFLR